MTEQEDSLDQELKAEKKSTKKSKSYYENRALIYVVLMIGGGLIYSAFISEPIFHVLIDGLFYTVTAIATAIPLEYFRKMRRTAKNAKKGIEIEDDPLWFHIVESALSLLILVLVLSFLVQSQK